MSGEFNYDENLKKELPKKAIYKFRYGTKPPKEEYDYEFKFDFEPIEFDHRALQTKEPEPYKTFKFPEEHTLFLIKPNAMIYKDQIIKRIYDEGFMILKVNNSSFYYNILGYLFNN